MGRNSRIGSGEDATDGCVALPAAMVRELRHPEPVASDFTPTKFCPAATKAWFAVHTLRFVSSDFPRHQFTGRFYAQLMHCWGHIGLYAVHRIKPTTTFMASGPSSSPRPGTRSSSWSRC